MSSDSDFGIPICASEYDFVTEYLPMAQDFIFPKEDLLSGPNATAGAELMAQNLNNLAITFCNWVYTLMTHSLKVAGPNCKEQPDGVILPFVYRSPVKAFMEAAVRAGHVFNQAEADVVPLLREKLV